MIIRKLTLILAGCLTMLSAFAAKDYSLASPDGLLQATVSPGDTLMYSVSYKGKTLIDRSPIVMRISSTEQWGITPKIAKASRSSADRMIPTPLYRDTEIRDAYNQLTLRFKGGFSVCFRAYNDGVAYRFESEKKGEYVVVDELVEYRFPADWTATVPYVRNGKSGDFERQFDNSFENAYTEAPLTGLDNGRLIFLPMVVSAPDGVKLCFSEADLIDYPGLYLRGGFTSPKLTGIHAAYPKKEVQGGHNELQLLVKEREDYIAKIDGPRTFPWRIAIVAADDKALASSQLNYLLAEPSRLSDISWIKPGKVAWDWWNAWNLDSVDFKSGINNDTYKYYIDFAANNGIEYVILDEGWAVNKKADLMQVVPEIDMKQIIDYANSKGVGIILWAGYYAFDRDMEQVCKHYADMGVKGFKVDFFNRDDQKITNFNKRAAEMAAKYKLMLDLHGTFKPAGLQRTYPNIINFEGVNGLEQMKWAPDTLDQVTYDVQIPFIRQVAGPMDYTQGAMRNASRKNYKPIYTEPMSQGTRTRQLALYMIFDSPLNMLCDTPSAYMREPESTAFIADVPTTWDETIVLDAKMGDYIVTARRKGADWYVGGITDWTPRDIEIDFSFLGDGSYNAVVFTDGINADKAAHDYKRTETKLTKGDKLKVHLAPGGGVALKASK